MAFSLSSPSRAPTRQTAIAPSQSLSMFAIAFKEGTCAERAVCCSPLSTPASRLREKEHGRHLLVFVSTSLPRESVSFPLRFHSFSRFRPHFCLIKTRLGLRDYLLAPPATPPLPLFASHSTRLAARSSCSLSFSRRVSRFLRLPPASAHSRSAPGTFVLISVSEV